jgi:hypothetical protein
MPKFIKRKPKGINSLTIIIAYEGEKDEKIYFERLARSIPNQFRHIVKFIPVDRAGSRSNFTNIYNDLLIFLDKNKIKLKAEQTLAFIVYDKDKNYSNQNIKKTMQTLAECKDKGIECLVTAPSFELWILLHYIDISEENEEYRNNLIINEMVSGRRFIKKLCGTGGYSVNSKDLFDNLDVGLSNEKKMNRLYDGSGIEKPVLFSSVGDIFRNITQEYKIPLNEYIESK